MKTHTLFILATLAIVPACKGSDDKSGTSAQKTGSTAEANASDALVEALPFGTVSWTVRPDGSIGAAIKADDGGKTTGQVIWREGDEDKTATLTEDTRGALAATGPKLTADVTDIRYTLQHGDSPPVQGVLQVPPGGTAQIAADAKANASATAAIAPDAAGPHGGTVQVVGDDHVEVVADGSEVKAWLLDAKLQPMTASIDGRTITIAAADETPHTITLTFDATAGVYVGKWTMDDDPKRLTIVVNKGGVVHATLAGYKPGVAFACGEKAPRIKVHVHSVGGGPKNGEVVDVKVKIKDDDKGAKPASVKIDIKEKGDKDKDKGEKGNGKAKGKDK